MKIKFYESMHEREPLVFDNVLPEGGLTENANQVAFTQKIGDNEYSSVIVNKEFYAYSRLEGTREEYKTLCESSK